MPARPALVAISLAGLWLALTGCQSTSSCSTCFVDDAERCERWSGDEETSRDITVRKLCSGEVPEPHREACQAVLEIVENAPRKAGGRLATPLIPDPAHFDVQCDTATRFQPFSGCGGFN